MVKKKYQDELVQVRRNHILNAAIEVISEQGFQRTTIKQIAARAEVSDGTIYNYFKNKDDILFAIMTRMGEAELSDLENAEENGTNFEAFATYFLENRLVELDQIYPTLKVMLVEILAQPALCQQAFEQMLNPVITVGEAYFQQLIGEQSAQTESTVDAATALRLFAAPILGLLLQRMLGDEHIAQHWERYSQILVQLMPRLMEEVLGKQKV